MKIAIHKSSWGFSQDWITYCIKQNIEFKTVDCRSTDITHQLDDCDALMWHHHHTDAKDVLFAEHLLFAVQQSGKKVFPDFNTSWHFDDKVGQKYLLELINAPVAKSWVFYEKKDALAWVKCTSFPKVFKLRGGAGSSNVQLVKTEKDATKLVKKAFGSGFSSYNKIGDLKENIRKFTWDKSKRTELAKSFRRLFYSTRFARTVGPQKGYILFQQFIPDNKFDIRVITIGERAFAIKRLVRDNDFRASGSGRILYNKSEIDERCVTIAFETTAKLNAQCVAYDFVFDENNNPLIVEINYGFAHEAYFPCPGYWDRQMKWHEEKFNSAEWIVEELLNNIKLGVSRHIKEAKDSSTV
jgi:glutathione synthase/RimK-type ligase-like ATP-grasp enzyme